MSSAGLLFSLVWTYILVQRSNSSLAGDAFTSLRPRY